MLKCKRKYCSASESVKTKNIVTKERKPPNFWKEPSNQRKFLNEFSIKYNYTKLDDWYQVTVEKLRQEDGGLSLLRVFDFSPIKLLRAVYHDHKWDPLKFKKSPQNIWTDSSRARTLMDDIAKKLGVATPEDWYAISREQVAENGGLSLLLRHDNSFYETLKAVYPEHVFQGWRFRVVPRGFWTIQTNRRQFLEESMKILQLESLDRWYSVQQSQFAQIGGSGLLGHFKGKLSLAIMDSFPEHEWEPWRFSRTISGYWKIRDNRERYFDWLAGRLRIESKEDWYRISVAQVRKEDGAGILQLYNDSLQDSLKDAYPNHHWDGWRFQAIAAALAPGDQQNVP